MFSLPNLRMEILHMPSLGDQMCVCVCVCVCEREREMCVCSLLPLSFAIADLGNSAVCIKLDHFDRLSLQNPLAGMEQLRFPEII